MNPEIEFRQSKCRRRLRVDPFQATRLRRLPVIEKRGVTWSQIDPNVFTDSLMGRLTDGTRENRAERPIRSRLPASGRFG